MSRAPERLIEMAIDRGASTGGHAHNFLRLLAVIDRTILPRKILIANGQDSLTLTVARQRAFIPRQGQMSSAWDLQSLALAVADICRPPQPIDIRIEASPSSAEDAIGFTAIEIVNGQTPEASPAEGVHLQDYRFTPDGWPVAAPSGGSLAALAAAARFTTAISDWQTRHQGRLQTPMLILAVSPEAASDLSVSVGKDVVVARAGSAQLGRVVSEWRRSELKFNGRDGPEG
jgi:hypothetical protein